MSLFAQVAWQARSDFGGTERNHAIGFSYGTDGYVMTGVHNGVLYKDFWQYNSLTDVWIQLPDFPGPARSYGVGYIIKDKAYVGLGHSSSGFITDFWEYNFSNTTWTQKGNFPGQGRDHPCCDVIDSLLYVGFGSTASASINDWWQYNPATDKWTAKTNYPGLPMHHPVTGHYNNRIYLTEGHLKYGSTNQGSVKSYSYDSKTDKWTSLKNMPGLGVVAGAAFVLGDKLYSGVGIEEPVSVFHTDFYEYDIALNNWSVIGDYPGDGTFAPVTFIIGNDGYVVTGASNYADTKNCYRLHTSNTTAIAEKNSATQLALYPNPAVNKVVIESDQNGLVQIYNSNGSLATAYTKDKNIFQIDISNFSTGLYFLKLGNCVKKLIKE